MRLICCSLCSQGCVAVAEVICNFSKLFLLQGPLDDPYATSIRNCDAKGPLMVYVSKMIPSPDKARPQLSACSTYLSIQLS